VKVTDFGLATSMASDRSKITETGAYLGTPEYSSPEQCEGYELDGRSDIYSLGVVLYEMLTGNVPFEANTPLKLFDRIVHEEPVSITKAVPGLPREVNQLVGKMLEKDPEKRYASAEQLLSALRRVRVALGSWKRGAGTGRRRPISGRYSRGQRRGELIAAGVIIAMLIGAAIGIWRPTAGDDEQQGPRPPASRTPTPTPTTTPTPEPTPDPKPEPVIGDVGVAVFELEALSPRKSALLARGVPQFMIGKLAGVSGLIVYDREKVAAALKAADGSTTEATKSLGARLKVTGDYAFVGLQVQITLRVADVETGRVADQLVVRGSEEQILTLVDSIGEQLRGRFDSLLARILGRKERLADAPLPSARECMFLAAAPAAQGGPAGTREGSPIGALLQRPAPPKKPEGPSKSKPKEERASGAKPDEIPDKRYAGNRSPGEGEAGRPVRGEESNVTVGGGSGEGADDEKARKRPGVAAAQEPKTAAPPVRTRGKDPEQDRTPVARPAAPKPKPAPPPAEPKPAEALKKGQFAGKSAKDKDAEVSDSAKSGSEREPSAPSRDGSLRNRGWGTEVQLSEALRFFFEGQEIMEGAGGRADYSRALAKFANARGIAPRIKGLDEAIEKAREGMEAAKE
jgi:TolB-like protein